MSTVETRYEHIILDDAGVPLIAGTTMKVAELVLEQTAYGWSPEELHFQHPYLSLGESTRPWPITGIIRMRWIGILPGGGSRLRIFAAPLRRHR